MTSEADSQSDSTVVDPWEPIIEDLLDALEATLRKQGLPIPRGTLRQTLDLSGSSGWDVAMALHRLAKGGNRPPEELARELARSIPSVPGLETPEARGAYLNFRLDPRVLIESTLSLVLSRGEMYGRLPDRTLTVCVEHTSANPVTPFHIGRVRNAIIGDTLARVHRAAGSTVTTQYYVDDIGRQAALITWIWSKPYEQWPDEIRAQVPSPDASRGKPEKPDHRFGRLYAPASQYLKDHPEAGEEVSALLRRIEGGTPPPEHRRFAQEILSGMLQSLGQIGITFNELVWESDFIADGSVQRIVDRLKRAPHAVVEENGALAIDGSDYGLPKESTHIVIVRADGTSLYPTRDVAYHLQKFARFARVIDVLGQDHLLHAKYLSALLAEIGERRVPDYVFYQYITLPGGGKMSSRKGQVVYLDDLIEEAVHRARREILARREDLSAAEVESIATKVASAAIRYHIARFAPEKAVEFRWEDALSFEGRSGPFLQYAYARATSLLRKAERSLPPYPFESQRLHEPDEWELIKVLSRLPSVVDYASRTAHVHSVATYAHQLADQFNRFYQNIPVLKSDSEKESRIALVAACQQTLGNVLQILGLERLERM